MRDSIEPGRVHPFNLEPRLAFQLRDPTPRDGPETFFQYTKGYPFNVKAVVPEEGIQFFADVMGSVKGIDNSIFQINPHTCQYS